MDEKKPVGKKEEPPKKIEPPVIEEPRKGRKSEPDVVPVIIEPEPPPEEKTGQKKVVRRKKKEEAIEQPAPTTPQVPTVEVQRSKSPEPGRKDSTSSAGSRRDSVADGPSLTPESRRDSRRPSIIIADEVSLTVIIIVRMVSSTYLWNVTL